MDRILGIDHGDSRTGLAVSDLMGWTAQGIETVHHKGNIKILLNRIREIIAEYNVNKIVIGYPRNLNGSIGPRAEKTEELTTLKEDDKLKEFLESQSITLAEFTTSTYTE